MTRYVVPFAVAMLAATAVPLRAQTTPAAQPVQSSPQGNCLPGEKIDGSTAEEAKAKIEATGYSEVKIDHKGCDNFWHGSGVYGGVRGNVVLSPDGHVMPEGD